jgi:hypothetical protein
VKGGEWDSALSTKAFSDDDGGAVAELVAEASVAGGGHGGASPALRGMLGKWAFRYANLIHAD